MMYNRILFVGQSGACREVMAMGILRQMPLKEPVDILARGLVVLFSAPINQKAEAVLISNGIHLDGFCSIALQNEEITPRSLVLTFSHEQQARLISDYPNANEENTFVLSDYVGEEVEVIDPYGGTLIAYGLCYESLRSSLQKLAAMLNEDHKPGEAPSDTSSFA